MYADCDNLYDGEYQYSGFYTEVMNECVPIQNYPPDIDNCAYSQRTTCDSIEPFSDCECQVPRTKNPTAAPLPTPSPVPTTTRAPVPTFSCIRTKYIHGCSNNIHGSNAVMIRFANGAIISYLFCLWMF